MLVVVGGVFAPAGSLRCVAMRGRYAGQALSRRSSLGTFKAGTGAEAVRQGQECHEDEEYVPQWRGPD